jgi:hypothetical protein
MGTDIHLSAEMYDEEKKEWVFVPGPIVTCWSCEGTGVNGDRCREDVRGKPCTWCTNPHIHCYDGVHDEQSHVEYVEPGKTRDCWYSERNYTLFAILGGVRNGYGFAGAYRHEPVNPIAQNRGIPDDITETTRSILSDEHSGTWCDVIEILRYDWDRKIVSLHGGGVEEIPARECVDNFLDRMRELVSITGEHRARLVFDFDS